MTDTRYETALDEQRREGDTVLEAQVQAVAHPGVTDGVMSNDGTLPARIVGSRNTKPTLTPARTSADGRRLAEARWNTAERLSRQALAQAAGVDHWQDGVVKLVQAQAGAALSGKPGTSGAASFVMKAARLLREPEKVAEQAPQATGDAAELLALYRQAKAANPELGAQAARLLADGE